MYTTFLQAVFVCVAAAVDAVHVPFFYFLKKHVIPA
jgi:hypothetical protein